MKKTYIIVGLVILLLSRMIYFQPASSLPQKSSPVETSELLGGILGISILAAMITLAFCVASLRSHVDEDKLRAEKNITSIFRSSVPPERVLSASGLRRVKIAKFAVGVIGISTIAIVIANMFSGR